jgi:uncharacterized membrane protein YjdF
VGKGAVVAVNTTVGVARDGRTEVATVVGLAQAVITNISMRRHGVSRTKFFFIFFYPVLKTLKNKFTFTKLIRLTNNTPSPWISSLDVSIV